MKTILIDPEAQTVSEVEIEEFSLKPIYKILGCKRIDKSYLMPDIDLVVDDEGLLKDNYLFSIMGNIYAGKAIIARVTAGGDWKSPKTIDVSSIRNKVNFLGRHNA